MAPTGGEKTTPPPAARSGEWRHSRWVRPVRMLAWPLAVVCVMVLTSAGAIHGTVLDRGFYQGVLDDERAYDRLYDEVLVDPEARPVTRSLLARLPVPGPVVTGNLKTVLPPALVRKLTDEQIAALMAYLRGDTDALRVSVDLKPVLANVDKLAEVYLGELVSGSEERQEADLAAALNQLDTALEEVAAGRRPTNLPRVELSDRAVQKAGKLLLSGVPENRRDALRPQVKGALAVGDVATALAAVGPHLPGSRAGDGGDDGERELIRITDGGRWNVVEDLHSAGMNLHALESARGVARLTLGPVQSFAIILGVLAAVFLWVSAPLGTVRRLRAAGWILALGGAATAALFGVLRIRTGDLLWHAPHSWPPSLATLVEDLEATAADSFTSAGLFAALTPLTIGALMVAVSVLGRRHRPVRTMTRRTRTGVLAGAAALTTTSVVLGIALAPAAASGPEKTYCNGSVQLCELRYDQAAYVATHNAMSTTADRFISPLQDGDIVTQLDAGARALLIDTHTWERSDEIAQRLQLSEFAPDMQSEITGVINRASPARPGLWLCHALCRAGALPLIDTLHTLGTWLDHHPDEVVTLLVQDGITGEQTTSAFEAAGLDRLLFTPDSDPNAPWPTLGEMVEEDKRLVVLAENSEGPAPWYRNYYEYGMETPYAFTSPEEMSCRPNRGGTGKRLFLLNHFITNGGGSRIDARAVNDKDFVLDRARRCASARGHAVNFVAVDFANLGSVGAAVSAMNASRTPD